ncbi:MAG: hypothetical protein ACLFTB_01680 [Desulfovibrionales bacterium]
MPTADDYIKQFYNKKGDLEGVFITPELWRLIRHKAQPLINNALERLSPEEFVEPLQDWEMLKEHWDFKYPVDMDVHCDFCGNDTENWQEDDPRLFRLRAANLGGLVSFECLRCKSKITKKHFKKHIDTKTVPYTEVKKMI